MKKILINGGGYADIPLIKAAKELGFYVVTTGNNENEVGHRFSHLYIKADYSNKEEIYDIVKKYNINYIIPSCNDFSFLTVSYIAEKINNNLFDSFETSKIIHHKHLFKKFAIKNKLSVPYGVYFNNIKEVKEYEFSNFPLPCIIKPIDLSGGKGVNVAKKYEEILRYANIAFDSSREKKIIIEEYIDGEHYSCFMFIYKKEIKISFFAKEYFFKNKFLVSGAFSVYDLNEDIKERIFQNIKVIIDKLNLKDGLIHIQFIIKNNIPYIIEVTRRAPGDLYLKLIDYSLNIDISRLIIKLYCNILTNNDFDKKHSKNLITRHCIMSNKNGIFESIKINSDLKIIEFFPILKAGDNISNYLKEKIAIMFLQGQYMNIQKDIVINIQA